MSDSREQTRRDAGTIIYRCGICERGRESCQYCENVTEQDFEAICDCGLYDFGRHLTDCESQAAYKYVIACDYASAVLPR